MGFFKPASGAARGKFAAALEALVWVLIYGGLLTLVLGLSVRRLDEDIGWALVMGGALVAAVGVVLIYVRSKIKIGP
jgi:formate hydrogenlyase subunit 3/multisubunit Na+/H+ antiporter MnhD subunit